MSVWSWFTAEKQSLDALAVRYRTDKSSLDHNFAPFYEEHFSHLRNEPITLLEIGVGRGASIRMWRKYFRKAKLFAIECEARRKRYSLYGAQIFIGRQDDKKFLNEVMSEIGPVDILIDDGSHHVRDQQISLGALFPHVKDGGFYVIEDLHTSFWTQDKDFAFSEGISAVEMLEKFQKTGHFESSYLSPEELAYLDETTESCVLHSHIDKAKHLTSLLKKKPAAIKS